MQRSYHYVTMQEWSERFPEDSNWYGNDVRFLKIVQALLQLDKNNSGEFETLLAEARSIDDEIYEIETNGLQFLQNLSEAIRFLQTPGAQELIERVSND